MYMYMCVCVYIYIYIYVYVYVCVCAYIYIYIYIHIYICIYTYIDIYSMTMFSNKKQKTKVNHWKLYGVLFAGLTHKKNWGLKLLTTYYGVRNQIMTTTFIFFPTDYRIFSNKRLLSFKRPSPINAQYNPKNIL